MFTVVVTGRIGGGKTIFCKYLENRGVPVYYADNKAKELYEKVPGLLEKVEAKFNDSFRDEGGCFDKVKLAELVFDDKEKLETLEGLIYPLLFEDFILWRSEQNSPFVVIESAIILDKKIFSGIYYDYTVFIDAPLTHTLSRVAARDKADLQDILKRMDMRQYRYDIYDYKIQNCGGLYELYKKADRLLEHLNGIINF